MSEQRTRYAIGNALALIYRRPRGDEEKRWQQQVVGMAALAGWAYYHAFDSRRSPPGFPDLVLVRGREYLEGWDGPLVIFAEVKAETGQLSIDQMLWGVALEAVARVCPRIGYRVWRPSDRERVKTELTGVAQ